MIMLRATIAVVIWCEYAILKVCYNQLMIRSPGAKKKPQADVIFLILHANSAPEALEAISKT